jgi:hypothetical protein
MMEANDVLLWAMQWDCLRVFPQVEELRSKIEEFHLAAAEPDTAQNEGGGINSRGGVSEP